MDYLNNNNMKKTILTLSLLLIVGAVTAQETYKLSINKGVIVPKSGSLTEKDTFYFAKIYEIWFSKDCEKTQVGYEYFGSDTVRVVYNNNFSLPKANVNALYDMVYSSIPQGLDYTSTQNYLFVAGMRLKVYEYFGSQVTLNDIVIIAE